MRGGDRLVQKRCGGDGGGGAAGCAHPRPPRACRGSFAYSRAAAGVCAAAAAAPSAGGGQRGCGRDLIRAH